MKLLQCCAVLCGVLGCSASFVSQAQAVKKDIEYTRDRTGTYRGDLYRPAGAGPFPAVVMIHGGAWRSGSKGEFRQVAIDLAKVGYVGFSIDYDTHSHSFPTSWQEARAAVVFLREHATEYGIDAKRIAVMGSSAGGQLAALLVTDPEGPHVPVSGAGWATGDSDTQTQADVPIEAALLLNGIYDLHMHHFILRRYLGGNCDRIPAVCDDASPENHLHHGMPAVFVGHGTSDGTIPISHARDFIKLLQNAGGSVTPFIAEGAPHSYWRKKKFYAANLAAMEQYLQTTFDTGAHLAAK